LKLQLAAAATFRRQNINVNTVRRDRKPISKGFLIVSQLLRLLCNL